MKSKPFLSTVLTIFLGVSAAYGEPKGCPDVPEHCIGKLDVECYSHDGWSVYKITDEKKKQPITHEQAKSVESWRPYNAWILWKNPFPNRPPAICHYIAYDKEEKELNFMLSYGYQDIDPHAYGFAGEGTINNNLNGIEGREGSSCVVTDTKLKNKFGSSCHIVTVDRKKQL